MDYIKLKEYWISEEKETFQGWDFSHISGRMLEEALPWDYDKVVRKYLHPGFVLLDMGTGGGEYLLSLHHPYNNTFATESYLPNFEICKEKLAPLGIDIRQVCDDKCLPFQNDMFDIIINRHESFDINEVYRLLKPNGFFITQQVGGLNNKELSGFLIRNCEEVISSQHTLKNNIILIENKGLKILKSQEYFPKSKFFDIGALVYFARIIEWEFPGFSVENCFGKLCKLQSIINQQGYIESQEHRFIVVSRKPE